MTLPVQRPVFQDPPDQYNASYMKQLIKQLELYMRLMNAPGPIQASAITLTALPTSSVGLKSGDLWNDAGTVKIV